MKYMKTDIKNDFLVYVIELFSTYNIFDYILRHYIVLHTMGGRAIVDDINLYINR